MLFIKYDKLRHIMWHNVRDNTMCVICNKYNGKVHNQVNKCVNKYLGYGYGAINLTTFYYKNFKQVVDVIIV